MGSPLSPLFANFYMGNLEKISLTDDLKPKIYTRYVDDIFLQVADNNQIEQIKQKFESTSVLKFTVENNLNNKLPFLDILVDTSNDSFHTTVYRKSTNYGTCLNGNSECTNRYKTSVINSYIQRAYKVTQTWTDFHQEINTTKQILINNHYSNSEIDLSINKFLDNKFNRSNTRETKIRIPIYYQNQMHKNYRLDERIINNIITNNTIPKENHKLNLIIYYKNRRTSNLIMKNNQGPPITKLQQSRIVYQFNCPLHDDSTQERYIGYTENSLLERLKQHTYKGSIHEHFISQHQTRPTRQQLTDNTNPIARADNRFKLLIKEAILIQKHNPTINKQFDAFPSILKLNKVHNLNNNLNENAHLTSQQSNEFSAIQEDGIETDTAMDLSLSLSPSNNITNVNVPQTRHHISPNISNRISSLISSTRSTLQMTLRPRMRGASIDTALHTP